MHIQPSRTGAAASRRRAKKNPMEVLVGLREDDPTADQNRLFKQWSAKICRDDEQLKDVLRYAFTNYFTAIERGSRKPRERTKEDMDRELADIERIVTRVAKVALLELVMPNGKKLRDCTLAECSAFGGWLKLVATKGRPSDIVGDILSEDDLKKIR